MIANWTHAWAKQNELHTLFFKEIDSTNNYAKEYSTAEPMFLVLTDHQSAGRGRSKNSWTNTEPGTCLLSSWAMQVPHPPQPIASAVVGLTLFESAVATWPQLPWALKAPNDLYLADTKVAGLLIETVTTGANHRFVVGLGMNVKNAPKIASAGFVEHHLKSCITENDWASFLSSWSAGLQKSISAISSPTLNDESRRRLLLALNQYSKLSEKYSEVLPDGSLQSASGIKAWFEI